MTLKPMDDLELFMWTGLIAACIAVVWYTWRKKDKKDD
jgi:hypothetical protein